MLTVDFDRLGLRRGERVLDLGCGAGRHAFECLRRGAVAVALDADPVEVKSVIGLMTAMVEAGEVPEGGAGVAVRGDALRLPFPDGAFDKVICAEVLEHLPDDTSAMAELARVLRPGGTLAISVPRYGPEVVNWALSERYHSVPGGHLRIYRRRQLNERLRNAGLGVVASHHAHALHSPYWWLRCLVGPENDHYPAVRIYHRLLVWDITAHTPLTGVPEKVLNPFLGKSLVVYLRHAQR
ncbi:MAG TPA: class I SAM-dependent methyltransferase [Acidimicrobiales bacterium]|nr:class I SAM-dependent methyltransferase [Acidimicrobiales bacterium]